MQIVNAYTQSNTPNPSTLKADQRIVYIADSGHVAMVYRSDSRWFYNAKNKGRQLNEKRDHVKIAEIMEAINKFRKEK